MTSKYLTKRPVRRAIALATATLISAGALIVAPLAATAAEAYTPWWSPVYENCASKIVQLTFHVVGGSVEIGYNQNEGDLGNYPYWQLSTGTHVINTGVHSIWWEKYESAGDISSWSETCVSYL